MPGILLFASLLVLTAAHAQPSVGNLMHMTVLGLGLLALGSTAAQAFDWDGFRTGMIGLGVLFMLAGPALGRAEPSSLTTGPRLSRATLGHLGIAWTAYGLAVILMSLFAPQEEWITATIIFGLIGAGLFVLLAGKWEHRRTMR
jgi:hypothetical protein